MVHPLYMVQPQGFVDSTRPTHVCKLHKAIYGLKQAPHEWYLQLTNCLQSLGFNGSSVDTTLFVRDFGGEFIILLIYVDDIVVTSNYTCALTKLLMELRRLFSMKDLGPLHYFLGIEVKQTPSDMYLTQPKYVMDLLRHTNMHDAKPLKSPVQTQCKLG